MEYPVVEGKAKGRDLSYEFVLKHSELQLLEQGIPYRQFYHHSRLRVISSEFQLIKKITETPKHEENLLKNPANSVYNRYRDILPYRDSIVPSRSGDYINASLVDGSCEDTAGMFIATQGPLPNTLEQFWLMVWESDVTLIIMLCKFQEDGIEKCFDYLPSGAPLLISPLEITMKESTLKYPGLREQLLNIKNNETYEEREIIHLNALNWPDHRTPEILDEFYSIQYMLNTIKLNRKINEKALVHCSAGIGRTGILISLYNTISALEDLLQQEKEENIRVSVFGTVRRLREQRKGMVAISEQYKFLYEYVEFWLTSYIVQGIS